MPKEKGVKYKKIKLGNVKAVVSEYGQVTKDPYGLKKRFCNFMDNMMMGPYLSTGRILRKYDEVTNYKQSRDF